MRSSLMTLLMIVGVTFYSCSLKDKAESNEKQPDENEWVEMDSFHMIMSEAFHPYKDSANLEPVRRLAVEIAQEAEKWASASLPEKVKNDKMKASLNQLKADTRALSEMIKGGASDEEIGTSLQTLHDSFHAIMETWNGGGMDHQH
jgi:hypothetical protein